MMYSIPLFVAKYIDKYQKSSRDLFYALQHIKNSMVKNWVKEESVNTFIFCQYFMDSDDVIVDKDWCYMIKCPGSWCHGYTQTLFISYINETTEFVTKEYATIFTKQDAEDFMKRANINWELVELED